MLGKFYLNLKINRKIFLIIIMEAFIFGLLGMAALQGSYYIYDMQLHENVEKVLNMYSVNIENKLNEVSNLSYSILKDRAIQQNLETLKSDSSTYARFVAVNNINERLLAWHNSMSKPVLSIQIVDNNGNESSSKIKYFQMDKSRKMEIIKTATEQEGKVLWLEPDGQDEAIIQARSIRGISNLNLYTLGVLIIRIDPAELINLYTSFLPKYNSSFYIISPYKFILGGKDDFEINDLLPLMKENEGYFITNVNGSKELITYRKSASTGWFFINIVPYESIYRKVLAVRVIVVMAYAFVLIALVFLGFMLSKSITKPIENLTDQMKTIESEGFTSLGKIDIRENGRNDEIGVLQRDFKLMIKEIDALINENFIKQIQIRESEYKALQAQINPHFLYNTLDSINWMAVMKQQPQIAAMAKSLGDLLRSSISKKETVITLREEINILNDYFIIQKTRYQERLDLSVDIGEELLDFSIPKFTLQPIVENSINYGLEKIPGICRICIVAEASQNIITISISDNGPGIRSDILDALKRGEIQPKGSGIGLKNIDDRIKLIFGTQYGLRIDSAVNKGTTVSIVIPASYQK